MAVEQAGQAVPAARAAAGSGLAPHEVPPAAPGGCARVVGGPGDNDDGQEWEFLRRLRALGARPERAREAWRRCPKARGLAAAAAGRLQEAIRLLERARAETPYRDGEVEACLAELRAIRRLEQRLEVRPNDAAALLALGRAYFAQERGGDALACFERAARLAPGMAEAHALIGLELHFRGERAGAEAAYREALRLQPGHPLGAPNLRALLAGEPPGMGGS